LKHYYFLEISIVIVSPGLLVSQFELLLLLAVSVAALRVSLKIEIQIEDDRQLLRLTHSRLIFTLSLVHYC